MKPYATSALVDLPRREAMAFTLLEVVMAITIFAVAAAMMGAVYVNILNSYEAAARGIQRDEDLRFARQLLLLEADPAKAVEGGEFETPDRRRVRWSSVIEPTLMPDLFKVVFTCESQEGSSTRTATESFVLLRPSWSESGEQSKLRGEVRKRIQEINTTNSAK